MTLYTTYTNARSLGNNERTRTTGAEDEPGYYRGKQKPDGILVMTRTHNRKASSVQKKYKLK